MAEQVGSGNTERSKSATITQATLSDVIQGQQAHLRRSQFDDATALDGEYVSRRGRDEYKVVAAVRQQAAGTQKAA